MTGSISRALCFATCAVILFPATSAISQDSKPVELKCTRIIEVPGNKNYKDSNYFSLGSFATAYSYLEDGSQEVWKGSYTTSPEAYTIHLSLFIPGTVTNHGGLTVPSDGLLLRRLWKIERSSGAFTMMTWFNERPGTKPYSGTCVKGDSHPSNP